MLATKFGLPVSPTRTAWAARGAGSSRPWRTASAGLEVDHIDLYQFHRFDPTTDLEETLAALTDLVRAGKIRAFGCSTFAPERIVEAHWTSERLGLLRFRTEQPRYSILSREIEGAVLPVAQRYGMGVLSYGPLSAGWLSGRAEVDGSHRSSQAPQAFDLSIPGNQAKLEATQADHGAGRRGGHAARPIWPRRSCGPTRPSPR